MAIYEACPMFSGYGASGFYLNWLIAAAIFSAVFWGVKYLFDNKAKEGKKK